MILDREKEAPKPYVHQDHPRVMYKGSEHKKVNSLEEEKALGPGWSRTAPPPPVDPEPDIDDLDAGEETAPAAPAAKGKGSKAANAAKQAS